MKRPADKPFATSHRGRLVGEIVARALWPALLCGWMAAGPAAAAPMNSAGYEKTILPLFREYCFDCHGDGARKGNFALDGHPDYAALLADRTRWEKARQLLTSQVMPPTGKPSPTPPQRAELLRWIDDTVFFVDPARPDPGHVTLRRLNREEYNNTVRDVLGVTSRPADQFPADDSGYGFDNIGDVLTLSPLLMEKYLRAAREIAGEAQQLEPAGRVGVELQDARLERFAGAPVETNEVTVLQSPADEIGVRVDVPVAGSFRLLVRTAGTRGEHPARLDALLNGRPLATFTPAAEWKGRRQGFPPVSALVELPAGRHRLSLRRSGSPDANAVVAVDFLALTGPFAPVRPPVSPFLKTMLGDRPLGVPSVRFSGEDLEAGSGRNSLDTGKSWFASNGHRRAPFVVTTAGTYCFRFHVGAQQAGDDPVRFEVRLGSESLGQFSVTTKAQAVQVVEFERKLSAGAHDLQVWFVNEFKEPVTGAERWFWLHEFTVDGPLEAGTGLASADVPAVLARTARLLFRRPLEPAEARRLDGLVRLATSAGEDAWGALRLGLEALLVSSNFLFHHRPVPGGPVASGSAPVNEFTLASRLACFLWSSAPDDELLRLAETGQLRVRWRDQVERLLADPRARAFIRNFAGQWLRLRDVEHVAPAPEVFPGFTPELAADFRRETELFFEHVLRGNRSVLEFLDADHTFVNERLAAHYGIGGVTGDEFRLVSLRGTPRGGVLTHGSVLTITSHPTRTSPVNRGKWLLEQLLGTPPPPAPNNVPPLREGRVGDEREPVRKRLEEHRANPACAACHAFLDPMGFALENYDAIGRWRDRDGAHVVDASGTLVTGQPFKDMTELRKLLVRDLRGEFLRNLAGQLLTYALGRGVTWEDKLAVREIVHRTEEKGHGFREMIHAVCESVPFQRMRGEDSAAR